MLQKVLEPDRGSDADHDFPIVIATVPADGRQRRVALSALIILIGFVALTIPFANIQLAQVDAFVPVIQTVMCVASLLTATLLFAEYSVYPQRAVLALASGYVFSGLFAFLQTLAFPGAYAAAPLIGDHLNSAGWLFVLWHTTFLLSIIVYVMSKDAGSAANPSGSSTGVTIGTTVACVVAATAGLTWFVTRHVGYLPVLYQSVINQVPSANAVNVFLSLLNISTLVFLFVRRRTILDHWLVVALVAWIPNFVVSVLFTVVRFTVGWYASRLFALCAGSALLFALLAETVVLYRRLAAAFTSLRREQTDRRAILDTVVDGIITISHNGIVETLNPAAARLFGYSPQELIGNNVKMLMPEPYRSEHDRYLATFLQTGQAKVIGIGRELTGLRKNGSIFPMELAIAETGERRFTGVVRDISERKRAEEHQKLLVAELDHRVKNILARAVAVIDSTRQGSASLDDFIQTIKGRLRSMADAHGLLSQSSWRGVRLGALVREQLAPYATKSNVSIGGTTEVVLSAAATPAIAMVLHELVTNAAKYGALSIPNGHVSVGWELRSNGAAAPTLRIEWRELDGPPPSASLPSGYGTNLIRDLIPHELGGIVDLVFAPDGAVCKIELPLKQQ